MFFQQALTPKALLRTLPHISECFLLIQSHFQEKNYQVAVYKYENEYFILRDELLLETINRLSFRPRGDEAEILAAIEEALDANHYLMTEEKCLLLDLRTIDKMGEQAQTKINYFEFVDL
ncbi:hypothetical protein IGI37_001602 [Enterococcus sp. AZ194]|uniref:hypothetical protein n=1 Tax=Enterococcus sp. AZ194 TaxID=2774629 RepID=UPI003F27E288